MRQGDLTTLSNVKAWLGTSGTAANAVNDALLMRLIASASAYIINAVGPNTFSYGQISRSYDGNGKDFIMLRDYPVQSIVSIGIAGQTLPITTPGSMFPYVVGYMLDPPSPSRAGQRLMVVGNCFPTGRNAAVITYMAGYAQSEVFAIPVSPAGITVTQLWTADISVITAIGVTMTKVAANPAAGQYAVAAGVYTFNAADAGTQVSIRYSYIPADIEQVACEMVGLRVKAMARIGVASQSLAGKESTTYFGSKDINGVMASVLQPYKDVVPY